MISCFIFGHIKRDLYEDEKIDLISVEHKDSLVRHSINVCKRCGVVFCKDSFFIKTPMPKVETPKNSESAVNLLVSFSRELFKFNSKTQWINKAQGWFSTCGVPKNRYIAIDTKGRICVSGKEFMRAEKDDSYPIIVYEI